jgi:diadenosine tetraphosphatase ApaH/serine/threonine PP2A family protein phosphatase
LFFSDVHGNLQALEAVIEDVKNKDIDAVICLGDFVGYGASPNECIRAARALPNFEAVLGNHDAAVLNPQVRQLFNPVAQAGIIYSEQRLDLEGRQYLERLPLEIDSPDGFLAVHSSPYNPETWVYVIDPLEAADAFHVMRRDLAFIGHTHYPAVHFNDNTVRRFVFGETLRIDTPHKCIVNVGSVGQPRDGDPRAAYVVYDADEKTVEMHRVEYDVDTAAQRIVDAGLPPMLADRLRRGY